MMNVLYTETFLLLYNFRILIVSMIAELLFSQKIIDHFVLSVY